MPTPIAERPPSRLLLGVAATVVILGLAAGCGGSDDSLTVRLSPEGGSSQSGSATFTAKGDRTRVTIEVENAPAVPQPSHIHEGRCESPNPRPAFALNDVESGKAETTVDVPLEELLGDRGYYVNVHRSAAELEVVVACGQITRPAGGNDGRSYGRGY